MMRQSMVRSLTYSLAASLILAAVPAVTHATPYASGITKTSNSVSFILNEPTASLTYTVNGGASQALTLHGTGLYTFPIPSANAAFTITADNTSTAGFTIPKVGTTVAQAAGHFSIDTQAANVTIGGAGQLTSDSNGLMNYYDPHGVDISRNPNSANFGITYVSNSNTQPAGAPLTGRTATLAKGLFAVKADGSDAFGYGDTAQQQVFNGATTNSPHRLFVADDGTPYLSGASDAVSGVFQLSQDLTQLNQVFPGVTGPDDIDITQQNHGSVYKGFVTGSTAAGNLTVYTLDEDLSSAEVHPSDPTALNNNTNRLWKYNYGSQPLGTNVIPTEVTDPHVNGPLLDGAIVGGTTLFLSFIDMAPGKDGKFYLSQNRSNPATIAGLYVLNPDGTTAWDSLTATRALPGVAANANDLLQNTDAVAVSPDQKWLADLHGDNFITLIPLINGIPDLANRLAIDSTGFSTASGRDINFDAADNLWYVTGPTAGPGIMREFTPGGHTTTTLTYNGTNYAFALSTGSAGLAGDYDGNGVVDMRDYVVWRNGGSPNPNSPADYDTWRANFGNHNGSGAGGSLGGGAAVPEPASLGLLLFGLVAAFGGRRTR